MTTNYTAATMDQSTDAAFRAWGAAFNAMLAAAGLVQTSDTGQINWTTVTRPGTGPNAAGYEIWRFNDALQSTAPIYIKIEYGCGTNSTIPAMWITVGTSTNGAGTIPDPVHTTRTQTHISATPYTGTHGRWACHAAGFLGVAFHYSQSVATPNSGAHFAFMVSRFCDADGTPNGNGFVVTMRPASSANPAPLPNVQAVRTASPAVVYAMETTGRHVLVPHRLADSHVSADIQLFPHWYPTPRITADPFSFTYVTSELGFDNPISAAVAGATARTLVPLHFAFGSSLGTTGWGMGMLWE